MKKVDYSSEAISRRLRQTEQLRRLSLSLIKAKRLHDQTHAAQTDRVNGSVEIDREETKGTKDL